MLFYACLVLLAAVSAKPSTQIEDNCIPNCSCTNSDGKFIIKSCKNLSEVKDSVFKSLKKDSIVTLGIDQTEFINVIDEFAFKDFTSLTTVVIRNAKIGVIHPLAFSNIQTLSFENCDFESTPQIASMKLSELKFINCDLTEIPSLDCRELKYVNLSMNHINDINIEAFARLQSMEELDLSHNSIRKFPDNVFVNNIDLNTLYMDSNPLEYFGINTTNDIELLSLKSCGLTKFDEKATKHLDDLATLYLNDNKIDNMEGIDMAYMINLELFDISNNKLTKLNPDIFENNIKLKQIILDGNDLKYLPLFISALNKKFETYKFSCRKCGISQTIHPMVFKKFSALRELYLSDNSLTKLEDSFGALSSLTILDLSNNLISTIAADAFKKLQQLDTLYMSNNKLTIIDPAIFEYNTQFLVFDVSNNSLRQLWLNNEVNVTSLERFIVMNNKITKLTKELLRVTPNLRTFDVKGNPLECDDDFINGLHWLRRNSIMSSDELTHLDLSTSFKVEDYDLTYTDIINSRCADAEQKIEEFEKLDDLDDDEDDEEPEEEYHNEPDFTLQEIKQTETDVEIEDEDDDDEYDYNETPNKPEIESVQELKDDEEDIEEIHYAYIFSVSMVFVITALLVLCIAVTITLLILKNYTLKNANMPRFKIPTWTTSTGLKKHSGSIYRPLSEDFSAQTPQPKRYEFAAAPTVHASS